MVGFLLFVWLVTFIAFIVYWWKKRKARLAAGENYQSDPTYQKISKTKRIIGAVCIVSFILSMAVKPELTPEQKAQIQAREEKIAAEKAAKKAEDEKKAMEQAQAEKEANIKKNRERVASLSGEDKVIYNTKYQEYIKQNVEEAAMRLALQDVDKANAEKRKKEEEERKLAEIIASKDKDFQKELTAKWEQVDFDSDDKNRHHAMSIIGKYGANLKKAPAINVSYKQVSQKPWEYYGKVVSVQGEITSMRQFPPSDDNYFKPYASITIDCGELEFVFIDAWADVSDLYEGQQVTVKGLIYGLQAVDNRLGGKTDGIGMAGFIQ